MIKRIIILSVVVLVFSGIKGQTDKIPDNHVKYTTAYKFKDGLYLNFDQVKNNDPIQKSQIVTNIDYDSFDFYSKLFENKKISLYDNLGNRKEIEIKKIWGFSDRGILFINLNDEFNRIPVFGNICHFIANQTYTEYDPYNYYPYNRYSNYYYDNRSTKTVLMQYLIDFESGKIYDFNYKSVELLLAKDVELYEEFVNLSNRKKKKLKFLYVRKYNTKHPVYLPKN